MVWWSQYASCEPYEHVCNQSPIHLSSLLIHHMHTLIPTRHHLRTHSTVTRPSSELFLVLLVGHLVRWMVVGCDQEGMIPERVLVKKVHQASMIPQHPQAATYLQTAHKTWSGMLSIHPSMPLQIIYDKLLIRWNGEELRSWWDDDLLLLRCCVVEVCTYIPHTPSPSLTVSSLLLVLSLYSTSSSPLSL